MKILGLFIFAIVFWYVFTVDDSDIRAGKKKKKSG